MAKTGFTMPQKLAVFLAAAFALILLIPALTLPFGAPLADATDQYYINNTQKDTGSNNAVTAVVFDYRGFDTLGEATVLFVAVLAVTMIFRRHIK